jgi:hypothetical protein
MYKYFESIIMQLFSASLVKLLCHFLPIFLAAAPNQEWCKALVRQELPSIPGWCSQKKAAAMMDLIFQVKPDVCVEIGVFGGSSLFPTATALKSLGKGKVYAIDPWNHFECTRYFNDDANKRWWESVDLEGIYSSFISLINRHQVEEQCQVIRETSERAAPLIGEIDILHIDGNHCDEAAFIDVLLYEPKVRLGGYIWFDGWASAFRAYDQIKQRCHIRKVIDSGGCILLQKVSVD